MYTIHHVVMMDAECVRISNSFVKLRQIVVEQFECSKSHDSIEVKLSKCVSDC